MICRSTPDGTQVLIGLKRTEVDDMLDDRDRCAHISHKVKSEAKLDITVFVVDGDDEDLEAEFLRIIAISTVPEKGAKSQ